MWRHFGCHTWNGVLLSEARDAAKGLQYTRQPPKQRNTAEVENPGLSRQGTGLQNYS